MGGGGGGGGRQNRRVPPQPINSHHATDGTTEIRAVEGTGIMRVHMFIMTSSKACMRAVPLVVGHVCCVVFISVICSFYTVYGILATGLHV